MALKFERASAEPVDLTASLEFFVRAREDTTRTNLGPACRSAEVDSWYFGTVIALQPEFTLGNGLSFPADFGAGIYDADADGNFAMNFGGVRQLSSKETKVGFRGRLGGALKAEVAQGVSASLFGTVDYWSDMAYAHMPGGGDKSPSQPRSVCRNREEIDTKQKSLNLSCRHTLPCSAPHWLGLQMRTRKHFATALSMRLPSQRAV